jgi:hypothetical protein
MPQIPTTTIGSNARGGIIQGEPFGVNLAFELSIIAGERWRQETVHGTDLVWRDFELKSAGLRNGLPVAAPIE